MFHKIITMWSLMHILNLLQINKTSTWYNKSDNLLLNNIHSSMALGHKHNIQEKMEINHSNYHLLHKLFIIIIVKIILKMHLKIFREWTLVHKIILIKNHCKIVDNNNRFNQNCHLNHNQKIKMRVIHWQMLEVFKYLVQIRRI